MIPFEQHQNDRLAHRHALLGSKVNPCTKFINTFDKRRQSRFFEQSLQRGLALWRQTKSHHPTFKNHCKLPSRSLRPRDSNSSILKRSKSCTVAESIMSSANSTPIAMFLGSLGVLIRATHRIFPTSRMSAISR